MIFDDNDVLLMIGDSITDCGRTRLECPGIEPSLGNGYVSMVAATLTRRHPAKAIRIINRGNGGDTSRGLVGRWQRDVLDLDPNWLSIKIGINDVWRQFDSPDNPAAGVPIDEYEANLDGLLATTRPLVKGIILITPYFIEPNRAEPMRAMMDEYGGVMKALAEKHGTLLVDTQTPFDAALAEHHPLHFCADRVHPNPMGHYLLAGAFLEAVGISLPQE